MSTTYDPNESMFANAWIKTDVRASTFLKVLVHPGVGRGSHNHALRQLHCWTGMYQRHYLRLACERTCSLLVLCCAVRCTRTGPPRSGRKVQSPLERSRQGDNVWRQSTTMSVL